MVGKKPQHMQLKNATGKPIYVICFHLKKIDSTGKEVAHFWVGWECTMPSMGIQPVDAYQLPGFNCMARVEKDQGGNGKRIILRLTEASYNRVPPN